MGLRLRACVKDFIYNKVLVCRRVVARLVAARSEICEDKVARALVYSSLIKGNPTGVHWTRKNI